jgi:UDP-N-acetylmuramyl pentapeptide phosphotransferase/UDP-N-acetylglucosamine-1-phosphate transferase
MSLPLLAGIFATVFLLSLGGTRLALAYLKRRAILDQPNARSSHSIPTPRGGGLAVSAVLIAAWATLALNGFGDFSQILVLCTCAFGLAALSWWDDLSPLPARVRLIGQITAVSIALLLSQNNSSYFGGSLPIWLDLFLAGYLWVWFLNLFNFMDGIDGITATETTSICAGIAIITASTPFGLFPYAIVTAAAVLGFLWWNWPPARVFLGDVGSIPLGFLMGWLLLSLMQEGYWVAAVILPAYYHADASLTILRRMFRGERIWQAHKHHAYQQAVQRGWSHKAVVLTILSANIAFMGFAVLAVIRPDLRALSIIISFILVSVIIYIFQCFGEDKNL